MMKNIFYLCLLCAFLGGCEKEQADTSNIIVQGGNAQTIFLAPTADYTYLRFQALEPWTASMINAGNNWCKVSPSAGAAGENKMIIKAEANNSNNDRSVVLVLHAGSSRCEFQITQTEKEIISLPATKYLLSPASQGFDFTVTSNVPLTCQIPVTKKEWITHQTTTTEPAEGTTVPYTFHFQLTENTDLKDRTCILKIKGIQQIQTVSIIQAGKNSKVYYQSTDFTQDGAYMRLQRATEGAGINLVFMGDGFSDRLVADGTYEEVMRRGMEHFFGVEPYQTFRQLFNVYMVKVVSLNESYLSGQSQTALGCTYDNSLIRGSDETCKTYARKIPALTDEKLDETLLIVILNSTTYGGTTYMYPPTQPTDYASGMAVAYLPRGETDAIFTELMQHEAGGHGFVKLADEYDSNHQESISPREIENYRTRQLQGWYANITFNRNYQSAPWKHFITDPRYKDEQLGIYEGACNYTNGVFRPTYSSIMRSRTGEYNAPSREAIYRRIFRLAYGPSWKFDFERFAAYDLQRIRPSVTPDVKNAAPQPALPPLPSPRVVDSQL